MSQVNVRGAISPWVADLVGQAGTVGLVSVVHQKVLVQLHTSIFVIDVDLQQHRSVPKTIQMDAVKKKCYYIFL